MSLAAGRDAQAFRETVRTFIRENAPVLPRRTGFRSPASQEEAKTLREWRALLYSEGYLGGDWPAEWGGEGHDDPLRELILSEELERAGLPAITDQTHLAAFALLRFGTEQQKRQHLPAIRDGSAIWCQLFSEPEAGSDLAALRTRAVRTGDAYVVDGQKVWSSNAEWSDFGFLLARTGSQEERHRGITAFVVDMGSDGIDVRPLREITGSYDFSEVFFDGLRVPLEDRLGNENEGWRIALESLGAERSGIGAGAARLRLMFDDLVELARERSHQGTVADVGALRQDLGRLAAQVEMCNQLVYWRLARELQGRSQVTDIPLGKLAYSELNLEIAEYGLRLLGAEGLLNAADGRGRIWQDEFLYARTYTIAGGSSEIMRNVIAERGLGMPREERPRPLAT